MLVDNFAETQEHFHFFKLQQNNQVIVIYCMMNCSHFGTILCWNFKGCLQNYFESCYVYRNSQFSMAIFERCDTSGGI